MVQAEVGRKGADFDSEPASSFSGRSRGMFGSSPASIPYQAQGEVSSKNKRQTSSPREDSVDGEAGPPLRGDRIISPSV